MMQLSGVHGFGVFIRRVAVGKFQPPGFAACAGRFQADLILRCPFELRDPNNPELNLALVVLKGEFVTRS